MTSKEKMINHKENDETGYVANKYGWSRLSVTRHCLNKFSFLRSSRFKYDKLLVIDLF